MERHRWGLIPGSARADGCPVLRLFLHPTVLYLQVASLEGWLVLVIFLGVAIVVVERIQTSMTRAREAIYMYELCSPLSDQRTQDAVAHTAAHHIQQLFQAIR